MHIVDYRPRTNKQQLIFLSPRIEENLIWPRQHSYDQLRHAAELRVDAMCRYATETDRCRSRQLVEYFGEQPASDCGICDVCRKRDVHPPSTEQAILTHLHHGPLDLQGLTTLLFAEGIINPTPTLRQMVDRGEVIVDADMTLRLPKKP